MGLKKNIIFRLILPCLILIITCSSCMPIIELNKRGLILSFAVDYKDKVFDVYIEMFNPSGGKENISNNDDPVIHSQGTTLMEAMKKVCIKNEKKVYYRVNNLILISRSVIENKNAFKQTVDFLNKTYTYGPNIIVAVSFDNPGKIIGADIQSSTPSNVLKDMIDNAEKNGFIQKVHLSELVDSVSSDTSLAIPVVSNITEKDRHEKEDKAQKGDAAGKKGEAQGDVSGKGDGSETLKVIGAALIKDAKYQGFLPIEKMKYLQVLSSGKNESSFNLTHKKFGTFSFMTLDRSTKIKSKIINDIPHFDIYLNIRLSMIENTKGMQLKDFSKKDIKALEALQNSSFKKAISEILDDLLINYKVDLLQFTQHIRRDHYGYWAKNKQQWDKILSKMTYSINVNSTIDHLPMEHPKEY